MTNEEKFIKQLYGYLDIEFSEFDKGRILGYLQEYKDALPIPLPKIITNERVVLRVIGNGGKELSIVSPIEIMNLICKASDLTLSELTSKDRSARLITARHVSMYLIRNICGETFLDIGKLFNRDHTTVISAITHVNNMIDTNTLKCIALIDYVNSELAIQDQKTA